MKRVPGRVGTTPGPLLRRFDGRRLVEGKEGRRAWWWRVMLLLPLGFGWSQASIKTRNIRLMKFCFLDIYK